MFKGTNEDWFLNKNQFFYDIETNKECNVGKKLIISIHLQEIDDKGKVNNISHYEEAEANANAIQLTPKLINSFLEFRENKNIDEYISKLNNLLKDVI